MAKKTRPKDRSEQEIAGYRDVLAEIHAKAVNLFCFKELLNVLIELLEEIL